MNVSMYDAALRGKFRFESTKGPLNLETLWEAPLTSRDGFNLNEIAKAAKRDVVEEAEENFVRPTTKDPRQRKAELKLDVVKHVISVKIKERDAAESRAARKSEKEKLLSILEEKQDEALKDLDQAAIKKRIAELDD
jgi:hypothetical protein